MRTKISRWGNSLGLRLPKHIVEKLKFTVDNEVEICIENDVIKIKKLSALDKMLEKITPENLHTETQTGDIVGKEIW